MEVQENILSFLGAVFDCSGWIASAVIFLHKFIVWMRKKRIMKAVLGPTENGCFLITQALFTPKMLYKECVLYKGDAPYLMLTENSAISISNITAFLKQLDIKYKILKEDKQKRYDEIHIGGPISNTNTNSYINQYFPNFHFVDKTIKKEQHEHYDIHRNVIRYSDSFHGFEIKLGDEEKRFPTNPEYDWIFLIKLTSQDLKCRQTVHLMFGANDDGTLMATEIFVKYYKEIYKMEKSEHYFLAIPVHRTSGLLEWSKVESLTDVMFSSE